jgi:hypothetical protein
VFYLGKVVGRITYHLWNFHIIIVIKLASAWHLIKLCIEESVDLHFVGLPWVRKQCWGQTGFNKQLRVLPRLDNICWQHRVGRGVTLIPRDEAYNFK